jgi:UDP-glucose 4-epimerase
MDETVVVTGGAGYIGSHACLALLRSGHEVIVFDNLSNGSAMALDRVRTLAGSGAPNLSLAKVDLRDSASLHKAMADAVGIGASAVMHFAGLKAVGESLGQPLRYYENNVLGTINLVEEMTEAGLRRLVFSSSCTVYGQPEQVPVTEETPRHALNPYGRTKIIIEQLLEDVATAQLGWHILLLRYFNPVGADPSGVIGEDPKGPPNNLMPNVMRVALGQQAILRVFGDDYDTPDGTCIRDYIHVGDLVDAHVAALNVLDDIDGQRAVNLGTGRGHSVLEVIASAAEAIGRAIPYGIVGRRPGDAASLYADTSRAKELIGWSATRSLDEMCSDTWRWQKANPTGYPQ